MPVLEQLALEPGQEQALQVQVSTLARLVLAVLAAAWVARLQQADLMPHWPH